MPTPSTIVAVIPAAGVGKRMKANCPKQYLTIDDKTILQHTVDRLLSHPQISKVIIAISPNDEYFSDTPVGHYDNVVVINGGKERVDSVLNGLQAIDSSTVDWAIVHDAARPCFTLDDLSALIDTCTNKQMGGLLATPVRDTMKRSSQNDDSNITVDNTVNRDRLWHALTPQMYPVTQLKLAIENGLANNKQITDEASAIELYGAESLIVEGSAQNIKITRPDDLALAEFTLLRQQELG